MNEAGLPFPPPDAQSGEHVSDGASSHQASEADHLYRPHDLPTLTQLVDSVRTFLESDVLPNSAGRTRFHARVAVNVLGMVLRELELGPGQAADHAERLSSLGVSSEEELAAAIRSGALDDRVAEVVEVVRATVADKLAVAHPGYTEAGRAAPPTPADPT
ncbi:MAG TPA: DUF6285 domain-containing protein [Acidimicrobiales bacterium]|nr:DUF6285 domain-containing protein [Acidimicrobiales bacterium]